MPTHNADYDFEDGPINRRTMSYWRLTHISDEVIPALQSNGVSENALDQMFVKNPRRFFEKQGAY